MFTKKHIKITKSETLKNKGFGLLRWVDIIFTAILAWVMLINRMEDEMPSLNLDYIKIQMGSKAGI